MNDLNRMKQHFLAAAISGVLIFFLSSALQPAFAESSLKERMAVAAASPYEADRSKVRAAAQQVLARLYQAKPDTKSEIENAVGFAVFSNFGTKILLLGGGRGRGVAVHNQTGQETFMKMLELQTGLGAGIKQFSLVFVFYTEEAFNHFVDSRWMLGTQMTAAAKIKNAGGAYQAASSVASGVRIYQLTKNGLALELTAKGTKYYQDKALNKKFEF